MKRTFITLIAAGSLTSAAIVFAFVPFNMGGCAASDIAANSVGVPVSGLVNSGVGAGVKTVRTASLREEPLGEAVAVNVTNRYGLSSDDNLNRYVTLVGLTVASVSPRPELRFYFGVLDTDEVNAFSGPNGYVMITRGALHHMQDESELAGVLSHEIGHVCKRHGIQAAQGAGFIDAGMTLAQGSGYYAQFGQAADGVVEVITTKGFSQPQEDEADAAAVEYVTAAGYDPAGYLHFLQRLQQSRRKGGLKLMSTHPGLDERVNRVSAEVAATGKAGKGAMLAERFALNVK